jgi:hypothetical protein
VITCIIYLLCCNLLEPSEHLRNLLHHFFAASGCLHQRPLLLLRLGTLLFVLRLPVRLPALRFSDRLHIYSNQSLAHLQQGAVTHACAPAPRAAVDRTVACGARCTTACPAWVKTLRVACCGSMLLLRAAPLCGGGAPGVGGQRRAGKRPLGGEGNAMQRTASRDGATPCTLPLEKQLQQNVNLRATLLKQNGFHHHHVSFPRALTPELTAPAQPFAV